MVKLARRPHPCHSYPMLRCVNTYPLARCARLEVLPSAASFEPLQKSFGPAQRNGYVRAGVNRNDLDFEVQ